MSKNSTYLNFVNSELFQEPLEVDLNASSD